MGIIALLAISAASAEISDVDTSDWFNITIFFIAAAAAFYIETKLFDKNISKSLS